MRAVTRLPSAQPLPRRVVFFLSVSLRFLVVCWLSYARVLRSGCPCRGGGSSIPKRRHNCRRLRRHRPLSLSECQPRPPRTGQRRLRPHVETKCEPAGARPKLISRSHSTAPDPPAGANRIHPPPFLFSFSLCLSPFLSVSPPHAHTHTPSLSLSLPRPLARAWSLARRGTLSTQET